VVKHGKKQTKPFCFPVHVPLNPSQAAPKVMLIMRQKLRVGAGLNSKPVHRWVPHGIDNLFSDKAKNQDHPRHRKAGDSKIQS
jgi:hypothetical protein